ncbi:MAG: hypothetical protein ACOY94_22885 [Bacillota bacterium]
MNLIGRFVLSFMTGYLMGALLTAVLVALCALTVVLQLITEIRLFPGFTLFRIGVLEPKRVHLTVETPMAFVPLLLMGAAACLTLAKSHLRRTER